MATLQKVHDVEMSTSKKTNQAIQEDEPSKSKNQTHLQVVKCLHNVKQPMFPSEKRVFFYLKTWPELGSFLFPVYAEDLSIMRHIHNDMFFDFFQ